MMDISLPMATGIPQTHGKQFQSRAQVDDIEGLEHGDQPRAKIGSVPDGTVITVHGHGTDLAPPWRHAGAAPPQGSAFTCSLKVLLCLALCMASCALLLSSTVQSSSPRSKRLQLC